MKHSFEPIIHPDSQVLILGTMPGDESIRMGQYYANPRNQFWTILSRVYNQTIGSDYQEKLDFLKRKKIALWDVLSQAKREGSSDGKIRNETPNDFAQLFINYPSIRIVAFNGTKAEKLFNRQIVYRLNISIRHRLMFLLLPSTSPIPGKYNLALDQKIVRWQQIKLSYLRDG